MNYVFVLKVELDSIDRSVVYSAACFIAEAGPVPVLLRCVPDDLITQSFQLPCSVFLLRLKKAVKSLILHQFAHLLDGVFQSLLQCKVESFNSSND
jgi:hypothetical protein